jgi:uncharacterized DUF497 family protein
VWIETLEIDEHIEDKIQSKHAVSFEECWEVCVGTHLERRGRDDTRVLLGRTEAGRYLMTVLAPKGSARAKLVTAREMTEAERRQFQEITQ